MLTSPPRAFAVIWSYLHCPYLPTFSSVTEQTKISPPTLPSEAEVSLSWTNRCHPAHALSTFPYVAMKQIEHSILNIIRSSPCIWSLSVIRSALPSDLHLWEQSSHQLMLSNVHCQKWLVTSCRWSCLVYTEEVKRQQRSW